MTAVRAGINHPMQQGYRITENRRERNHLCFLLINFAITYPQSETHTTAGNTVIMPKSCQVSVLSVLLIPVILDDAVQKVSQLYLSGEKTPSSMLSSEWEMKISPFLGCEESYFSLFRSPELGKGAESDRRGSQC